MDATFGPTWVFHASAEGGQGTDRVGGHCVWHGVHGSGSRDQAFVVVYGRHRKPRVLVPRTDNHHKLSKAWDAHMQRL